MASQKKAGSTEEQKQAAAPNPPVPKDQQNGVTRPKSGTQTGRVWEIADELSRQQGQPAPRKEVLEKFMAEGGNPSTGATQYGRWRKYHGLAAETGKPGRPPKAKAEAEDAPADEAPATAAEEAPVAPPTVEDEAGAEEEEA